MRIVTYRSERGDRAGVLRDGRVVDAWDVLAGARHEGGPPTVRGLLEADLVGDLAGALGASSETEGVPLDEVALVIGRRATGVGADDALAHVAGFTLFNDLSARDLQFATAQWMPGKVFDGSAPCGPALVTLDEAGAHDAIEISLMLNGETMQEASASDLLFGVPELVAHLSTLMTLEPGDIVSTGTPPGVGSVRKPRVWLKAGDEISIESPTLGRLDTRIA